jgi:AMMECR1 domain-containing protein
MAHPLVELAREAIRHYLETGRVLDVRGREGDGPARPLFVSLHDMPPPGEVEGELRGCRGSIRAERPTLYAEVVHQALASATDDPRCDPVALHEVADIDITVYLLGPFEFAGGLRELDPTRYGILVQGDSGRRGLLLPALPGVREAAQQFEIARAKAGIPWGEQVTLYRFEAEILR